MLDSRKYASHLTAVLCKVNQGTQGQREQVGCRQGEIRWLLYRNNHSIDRVKRIVKILNYAYQNVGPTTSISKTRIQALNNEKLSSVTLLHAFGEIFRRTYIICIFAFVLACILN